MIADHVITHKHLSHDRKVFIEVGYYCRMWYEKAVGSRKLLTIEVEEVFAALENLGQAFNYMEITIIQNVPANIERLLSLWNKHCSHAFVQLEITIPAFTNLNLSFPNAAKVEVIVKSTYALNVVYPLLESLTTTSEIRQFHQTRAIFLGVYPSKIQPIINFMRLNSHLRSFQSHIPNNASYLPALNEYLPNLEELSIMLLPMFIYDVNSWPTTRFRGVKHLSVEGDACRWTRSPILESLQFDHLESINARHFYSRKLDGLIDFVVNNTALRNVVFDCELSIEQFSRLITSLQELKSLTIFWNTARERHALKAFLEHVIASNHGLAKLIIQLNYDLSEAARQLFLRSIPQGWWFNQEQTRGYTLHIHRSN